MNKITEHNWNTEKISRHYDYLHKYLGKRAYNYRFGKFFTSKKILEVLKSEYINILDVGIGSGNLFRFLKINKINCDYTGADISEYFVTKAKKLYPDGNFIKTDKELKKNLREKYEFIYARGVLPHQTNPLKMLDIILNKSIKGCILDLKTRDFGKTEMDINKSFQTLQDTIIPHIVINYDELINFIKNSKKLKHAKIYINKRYEDLYGYRGRSIPKELNILESKTASTSLYINLQSNKSDIITSYDPEKSKKNILYYFNLILDILEKKF